MTAFNAGFAEAIKRLQDVNCRKLYCKSKLDPGQALKDTHYRFLPFTNDPTAGAATNPDGSVFLNTNGPFFNNSTDGNGTTVFVPDPSPQISALVPTTFGSSAQLGAFLLLHELGHELGIFPPDTNKSINGSNSRKVLEHCFKDATY